MPTGRGRQFRVAGPGWIRRQDSGLQRGLREDGEARVTCTAGRVRWGMHPPKSKGCADWAGMATVAATRRSRQGRRSFRACTTRASGAAWLFLKMHRPARLCLPPRCPVRPCEPKRALAVCSLLAGTERRRPQSRTPAVPARQALARIGLVHRVSLAPTAPICLRAVQLAPRDLTAVCSSRRRQTAERHLPAPPRAVQEPAATHTPSARHAPSNVCSSHPRQYRQNSFLSAPGCCRRGIASGREPVHGTTTTTTTAVCIPIPYAPRCSVPLGGDVSPACTRLTTDSSCVSARSAAVAHLSTGLVFGPAIPGACPPCQR